MTMNPKRLWAKSKPDGVPETPSMLLPGHLKDVHESSKRVLEATAADQLNALGLLPKTYGDRFRRCVLLAAAVHDLGKANDHFQGMLLRSSARLDKPQGLRHEWVTLLLLEEMKAWLLPALGGNETDFAIVSWAVAGHHPAWNHASPPRTCPLGAGVEIQAHAMHEDFRTALQWVKETFGLVDDLPKFGPSIWPLVGGSNVYQRLAKWSREAARVWQRLERQPEARLVAAIKNCLIAADVAGSALPKHAAPDWDSVKTALRAIPPAEDLDFLAVYGLEGHPPRDFQQAVADHPDQVVFVKAGCGTGKTVAAYMRAAKQWKGRRLYFCYPTTGTATEGFKDYLFPEHPQNPDADTPQKAVERERLKRINADLFHSRSSVDFEIILTTGKDSSSAETDAAMRADALETWSTPIVACTVDTVLGIVQNNRKGLFGWPALAQSAFVFDEIHAYDDLLFGALLRFLRDLPGLPVLLMTASLPLPREEALRQTLKSSRNIDELKPIEGPRELEDLPRYHKLDLGERDLLDMIAEEVARGGKVLWVSNTVNRVMAAADSSNAVGLQPRIYHSRFKYEDRVQRHKAVVDAFDPKTKNGVLACTSQVCEMSPDLKGCTMLVTERAPVPALIQRLGRLNRHAKPPAKDGDPLPPTMPFIVLRPENHMPYTPAEMDESEVWLAKLTADNISQKMLADAWEQTAEIRRHWSRVPGSTAAP